MTLLGCARCGLVSECARPDGVCPRCGHALHLRKPESLERCSAFLLAAAMLYVPSNLLPVVSTLGIVTCGAMIYGLGWTNWLRLAVWLAIGLVIYFGYARSHSRLHSA